MPVAGARSWNGSGREAAAVFPAAPVAARSNDVEYRYRQDSDLLYLTGFRGAGDACACLLPGHPKEEFILFVQPRDPERETWTGRRAGVEGAMEIFGAQMAYTIDKLDEKIGEYVSERDQSVLRLRPRYGLQRPRGALDAAVAADAPAKRDRTDRRPRSRRGPARDALAQERGRAGLHAQAIAISAEAHRGGDARGAWRRVRARDRGLARLHVPAAGRRGPGVPVDRGVRTERDGAALHHQRSRAANQESCC